jgi:hypothetical protein
MSKVFGLNFLLGATFYRIAIRWIASARSDREYPEKYKLPIPGDLWPKTVSMSL